MGLDPHARQHCRLHDGAGMRSLLDDGATEKATHAPTKGSAAAGPVRVRLSRGRARTARQVYLSKRKSSALSAIYAVGQLRAPGAATSGHFNGPSFRANPTAIGFPKTATAGPCKRKSSVLSGVSASVQEATFFGFEPAIHFIRIAPWALRWREHFQ